MATGRFMQSGSACMMDEFRSDHACMIQNSETELEFMHAASQPARAPGQPPAGSWQDGGCRLRMVLGRSNDYRRARMHGGRSPLHLRAPVVIRSP